MTLEDDVLDRVTPTGSDKDRIDEAVDGLKARVRRVMDRHDVSLEMRVVGSYAKGTYLNDPDIDLFLLFPTGFPRDEMDRTALMIGKEAIGGKESYADHPYIKGTFMGVDVDIVPCYSVGATCDLMSAVDRTPFHMDYVLEHMSDGQRDQVRLLKAFMKGIGTYGAEARVEGFSGYLNELLVLRYGDFRSVLMAALTWRPGVQLSLHDVPRRDFSGPMVFYDPVDERRNVASALCMDAFARFIRAAQEYLNGEDERFFFPEHRDPMGLDDVSERYRLRGTRLVSVSLDRPDTVEDNLYPQVRRTKKGLMELLQRNGYVVMDSGFSVDGEVRIVFELAFEHLPKVISHRGPPVWAPDSMRFLSRWEDNRYGEPYLHDGRWYVFVDRVDLDAVSIIERRYHEAAVGSDFGDASPRVRGHEGTLSDGFVPTLSSMLDRRMPWEIRH